MTLHGAIDDATNTVLALHFRPTEDLHGYAVVFQQLFTQYGLPLAFYGDRINILVRNDPHWSLDEQLRGAQDPTHLGRILHDLGIGYIAAGSPEAKGRVERLWRTLQDRLTSELRLRHITTPEAANAFLPSSCADFNARFTRIPADAAPAWRRAPRDLALVLSCRYTRRVGRDNTVHLGPRWLQLPPGPHQRSYARCRVELRELLDGRLVVLHEGAVLATQPAPPDFSLKPHSAPSSDRRHPAQRPGPAPEPLSRERAAPHTARINAETSRQGLPLLQNRDLHAPRRATRGARPLPKRPRPCTPYRDDTFMLQLTRHLHLPWGSPRSQRRSGSSERAARERARKPRLAATLCFSYLWVSARLSTWWLSTGCPHLVGKSEVAPKIRGGRFGPRIKNLHVDKGLTIYYTLLR